MKGADRQSEFLAGGFAMHASRDARISKFKVVLAFVCLLAMQFMPVEQAFAGNNDDLIGGIIGGIIGIAIIANAQKSWEQVDPNVRNCLATQYGIDPNQYIQQGIAANDQRLASYMQACQQAVAEAMAREQAAIAAQQAQAALAEKARQDALAAEAAAKAEKEAKHRELVNKYGSNMADAIVAGEVRVGMNKEEVIAARGEPDKKEVIPPNDELWQYGAERIAISNGKVTYVGH